jgi:hypothetical protein
LTEFARAVRVREWRKHAIATPDGADLGSYFFDHAQPFMADTPTWLPRVDTAKRPEIRAADRGVGDANNRIGGLLYTRIGHLLHANVVSAVEDGCAHRFTSFQPRVLTMLSYGVI